MIKTVGYAAQSASAPLSSFSFERREPGAEDVQIDILYCGVCHSDLHTVRDEWKHTTYPAVVGHEIIGRVVKTGANGGIAETQEMLDFCAEHSIVSDIEIIPINGINEAYERMLKSDVKYRFVIDMSTLKEAV